MLRHLHHARRRLLTLYYYRVRSYNANGNSAYSAVVSRATGNAPPVLTAIGDKTVAVSTALAFTAVATDPNAPAAVTACARSEKT